MEQRGESRLALIAGVNLTLTPGASIAFAVAGMTSACGRSHTFDFRADGYGRAEACVAISLRQTSPAAEPVSEQVILGAGVRQDGRSASLTAPNGLAQQELVSSALADGGVAPSEVASAEAHGTGTALGDPIEAGSLCKAVLCRRESTCRGAVCIGGGKANWGHSEPVAGLSGLLKLAVEMESGLASPNAHLRVLNPHVGCALKLTASLLQVGVSDRGVSSSTC